MQKNLEKRIKEEKPFTLNVVRSGPMKIAAFAVMLPVAKVFLCTQHLQIRLGHHVPH